MHYLLRLGFDSSYAMPSKQWCCRKTRLLSCICHVRATHGMLFQGCGIVLRFICHSYCNPTDYVTENIAFCGLTCAAVMPVVALGPGATTVQ